MNSSKIIINGQEYASLNEVPEQFRKFLADENQNGMPDAMEGLYNIAVSSLQKVGESMVIDARGQDFLNRLPPEAREKVQKSLEQLKAWKQGGTVSSPPPSAAGPAFPSASSAPVDYDKLYRDLTRPQGQTRSYWILAVGVGLLVVLGALGFAIYFLMPR